MGLKIVMAFLRQTEEKNDDDSLYEKSGDEDDRLRNYWKNERPPSTENEIESSNYPESQAVTTVSKQSDLSLPELESPLKDLDLSNLELKSKVRKLEYEIERTKEDKRNQELTNQAVINQLQRQNKASEGKRLGLENELIACKSRMDQLEYQNQ